MARSIDKVEHIGFSFMEIFHLDCMGFDCNPAFAFQIHIVQKLILLFSLGNCSSKIQQTICQGTFTVVNVGNDAKVSDVFHTTPSFIAGQIYEIVFCDFVF